VLRGKAMNLIAERVKVTDKSGNDVDIQAALNTPLLPTEVAAEDAEAAAEDAEAAAEDAEDAAEDAEAEILAATETDAPAEPSEAEESTEA
jgi:hypothetical protein